MQTETLITIVISAALFFLIVVPYFRKHRRQEQKAKLKMEEMNVVGIQAAPSLHPHFDLLECIGCGSCASVCPEHVIAIIGGKAALVEPAHCIGHGLCADVCPVGAITLLMANPGRSADLPYLRENYESNVEGLHIVGELGGLALIKNAVTQGGKVIEYIASLPRSSKGDTDVIIVGAGPAGLSAALSAKVNQMRYLILEQGDIGGTILHYPRKKLVMTSPVEIPSWGKLKASEISKESLLDLWEKVIRKAALEIKTNEKVMSIQKTDGLFTVSTPTASYTAERVVLALGRRGSPRKLGVPGEELSKVTYRLMDADQYQNNKILVVGGGDSAIEAALGLASQKGNNVILSYRKGEFLRIKERNRSHLNESVSKGKLRLALNSEVKEITPSSVRISFAEKAEEVENDFVFIFAGGELPNEFLKNIGVKMQAQMIQ
jgi:putative YpdA family bacillithiol system oxidoreductase